MTDAGTGGEKPDRAGRGSPDGAADPGTDPPVDAGSEGTEFPADPERARLLREVADDVRGESSESQQVAAILYRVSDLYDDTEDTSPEEIYRNVRHVVRIKERGGLRPEE